MAVPWKKLTSSADGSTMLRLALEAKRVSESLDGEFDPLLDAPTRCCSDLVPEVSLLSLQSATSDNKIRDNCSVGKMMQSIKRLNDHQLASVEAEVQPEEILKDYLFLPDLQQIDLMNTDVPPLVCEWQIPCLDFDLVLERDPFSLNPGIWREVETSGFGISAGNSGDLRREPTAMGDEFVFGSTTQMPFTPGGMEDAFQDSVRFMRTSPEEIEKGRQSVRNLKTIPILSAEFLESRNEELRFDDMEPSKFDQIASINGLGDILDEKELDLIKKLRNISGPGTTVDEVRDHFGKDVRKLLDMAGFAGINEEVHPEEYMFKRSEKDFMKIGAAADQKKCREWAVRVDVGTPLHDFSSKVPNMAHGYPFELDIFQKQAVLHLENHESVFVAAHTSAGKTVVAEYAIALSLRARSRCIYTSPIKALSNQKYRDFKNTFKDVGLLTGDMQIEPNSHCLIMTTEILRSMLYRGSEIIRDLDWVVFDEVHYMNDEERGVVWEEIMIMLPAQVGIVMLSATVPNAMEFADWVGRIKQRKIYVISTLKRPVPLEHHLFVCVGSKTIDKDLVVVNSKGIMLPKNHAEAMEIQKEYEKKNSIKMGLSLSDKVPPKQDKTVWLSFMDHIKKNALMPVIAFVFSRNRCDQLGEMLSSLDLTTQKEKHTITAFFRKAVSRLNESDRKLPQILKLEYYLERGVGIHHSGILPIMKESVEMLFQEGLVKVLLATETFAMGVNMPARTVVFDSIRKHDGTEFRDLKPGEYIQMSGRAGRRGLDPTGTVIILCKMARIPDSAKLNHMILGVPMKLESRFRLTYGMILHLLRIGTISMMDMMKRSFSENANTSRNPDQEEKLLKLMQEMPKDGKTDCSICRSDIENYYRAFQTCKKLKEQLNVVLLSAESRILAAGRIVTTHSAPDHSPFYGVILSAPARLPHSERYFRILEFTCLTPGAVLAEVKKLPCKEIDKVMTGTIRTESERIKSDAEQLQSSAKARKSFQELIERAASQLSVVKKMEPLSPAKDFKMVDFDFLDRWEDLLALESTLKAFECAKCPDFYSHMGTMRRRMEITEEVSELRYMLSNESLLFLPEYQQRIEVLKRMEYITETETITLRGRVACEISTTEFDLLLAECVFANVFTDREPEEIVALLSGFVFQAKTEMQLSLTPSIIAGIETIRAIAVNIGMAQRESGSKEAVSHLADSMKFGLAEVVYHWCLGMPFVEIASMTDVQEGIIVRSMTRLDEVCRDVRAAAKVTGNSRLMNKMEVASRSLKRDIAFVGSLYTTD